MDSVHDNGRVGESPDLRDLIDQTGAAAAAVSALISATSHAADDLEGVDNDAKAAVERALGDALDASFYLRRAVRSLRELI